MPLLDYFPFAAIGLWGIIVVLVFLGPPALQIVASTLTVKADPPVSSVTILEGFTGMCSPILPASLTDGFPGRVVL
jgi:hypothetical protein